MMVTDAEEISPAHVCMCLRVCEGVRTCVRALHTICGHANCSLCTFAPMCVLCVISVNAIKFKQTCAVVKCVLEES